jgi:hypothetical protein
MGRNCTEIKLSGQSKVSQGASNLRQICVKFASNLLTGNKTFFPGANPTTLSYNASIVKIYSATNSMARIKNENYFSLLNNTSTYYNAGAAVVNSKVVGLASGLGNHYICLCFRQVCFPRNLLEECCHQAKESPNK